MEITEAEFESIRTIAIGLGDDIAKRSEGHTGEQVVQALGIAVGSVLGVEKDNLKAVQLFMYAFSTALQKSSKHNPITVMADVDGTAEPDCPCPSCVNRRTQEAKKH